MSNPLLQAFDTPFETPPFDKIETKHFLPAIEQAITEGLAQVDAITAQKDDPTFENTIEALEKTGRRLDVVSSIFFNLNSAETNAEIQKIARQVSPQLAKYSNDIRLNKALFERVAQVWEQRKQYALSEEQTILLEKTYKGFVRNGAKLSSDEQAELRQLDEELGQLSLSFGEHVLAATNAYQLFLNETQMDGLPDSFKETAAEEAEAAGKPGQYLITLQFPSYFPFLTYAEDRSLREKLYRAYGAKAHGAGDLDNRPIIMEIVRKRHQRARLLGFENHAAYVLAERMAESPTKVDEFLAALEPTAKKAAKQDLAELSEYARERDGLPQLQRWDVAFYAEKLKQKRFEIDDETLKPYFALDKTVAGVFAVAKRLYGLSFEEDQDIPVYHSDVKAYRVKDEQGQHLAVFYADFYPRKGKRNGAWMTIYRQQYRESGQDHRPQVSIVCNFTKPSKKKPSLLTFNEVLTLFHEFGHALHGMLADGQYASLSGTNVYWDFVELPSQIMENWCYEKECLDLFAEHYETGQAIPNELVERLKASATFMEGNATLRQLSLARLDMAWHAVDPSQIDNVDDYEARIFSNFDLLPALRETNMSCQFGHIFQGGYSAGYYSYKWAEVLDADAFELFKEKGLFNQALAQQFKKLLSTGGAKHPAELYREFRGQDPDPDALLRRAGLKDTNG